MPTAFDAIIARVRKDVEMREHAVSLADLKERAHRIPSAISAIPTLQGTEDRRLAIIAEVKRRSPATGALAASFDASALAESYAIGGAAAISVQTDHRLFGGSLGDLDAVRACVDVPVMCNDFILTPYQIWEARAHGADIVLLMVQALKQTVLTSFVERVHSLGMTALVEVHDREEARRALDSGARVIGVNALSLSTMDLDMRIFDQVVDVIPSGIIRVAQSGARNPQDVLNYARSGAHAVLVGEALVTSPHPSDVVREMVAVGYHPSLESREK